MTQSENEGERERQRERGVEKNKIFSPKYEWKVNIKS